MTRRVGEKTASAWGLHDMHGNVWEWFQDWYGDTYYRSSLAVDPAGRASGTERVLRGGSWFSSPQLWGSAAGHGGSPAHRNSSAGFRSVQTP